jgi:GrpB-like predicted nucleotidyltransferase (UPF0157 family)
MVRKVEVLPFQEEWTERFLFEKELLLNAFTPFSKAFFHHIGSTSVPGLAAKPIIDIVGEAVSLELFDKMTPKLEALGYVARGENGIPGRRYFVRFSSEGERLVHLHCHESSNPEVERHLVFRDFLRAHPDQVTLYGNTKLEAARKFPESIDEYIAYKDPIIKELESLAYKWHKEGRS